MYDDNARGRERKLRIIRAGIREGSRKGIREVIREGIREDRWALGGY